MAEVDGEVDLVGLADLHQVAVLVHVDGHEVVADLRSVLCGVGKTELVVLRGLRQLGLLLEEDLVALHPLLPADLVEALSEEDDVGEDGLVEHLVGLARRPVQIQREDFVDQHIHLVVVVQFVVVALPVLRLRVGALWPAVFVLEFLGRLGLRLFSFFLRLAGLGVAGLSRELNELLVQGVVVDALVFALEQNFK